MPTQLTFFFLFIAVLALIAGVFWLVRRFAGNHLGANANRGRMPRLAVIDAAAVDGRRKLVLVRRDNVEHLLMIGGPSDIVIEPNIVRATPQRDPSLARGPVAAELPPRVAPLPDADRWADALSDTSDLREPVLAEPPSRPARNPFPDDGRRSAPAATERRMSESLASLTPEPLLRPEPAPRPRPIPRSEAVAARSEPQMPRGEPQSPRNEPLMPRGEPSMPRGEPLRESPLRAEAPAPRAEPLLPRAAATPPEPAPRTSPRSAERAQAPVAPAPVAASSAEQNLAEMAQRLEAALRRPSVETADRAPPVAPEAPVRAAPALRVTADAPDSGIVAPAVPPPSTKISLDNLEDEMASLLGRPKSST